jgi:hypothetical protein
LSDVTVRETPLVPDENPLASVDELLESALMRVDIERDPWLENMLRLQALYAVANVYPISEVERQKFFSPTTDNSSWQKHREGFGELTVVWNQIANDYELR